MGLLSRKLGFQAMTLEDPAQPLIPPGALFESLGLGRSDAGILVNEAQALHLTTVLACIKIISEDLGTVSHELFQQMPNGSMRLATDHRLWPIIHDRPNPHMSAAVFWGVLVASMLGWGNGYAWIKRDGAARVISLHPLKPGLTSPVKINGQLMYATTQTETGAVAYIDPENILHITYLSLDGITGISPIQSCKNAFGLALAAEKFGAQFFGNGARATGVFTYPGVLDAEAEQNIQKSVREKMNGENALNPLILEEGLKWQQITIPPNDAQFLATRQFQRVEVASLYRMAMHLLQDLQRATNNNIEHQSLDHVRYCLRPNAVKVEQEVTFKLLGPGYLMEHNLADMQRGDFQSQTSGYQVLRNIGVYSANDILRAMRQNPIPAEEGGDVRTVQGAMIPLTSLVSEEGQTAQLETAETDSDSGDSNPFNTPRDLAIMAAYRPLFRDAVGRVLKRGGEKTFARRAFQPIVASLAQAQLAFRFGNTELLEREKTLIASQVAFLVDSFETPTDGKPVSPAALATRFTELVYMNLGKEILG